MGAARKTTKKSETEAIYRFPHRHLLGIEGLTAEEIELILDLSDSYVEQNRRHDKKSDVLRGRTVINLFFENSTRTQTSFELAGKRLSGDVINMSVSTSSIKKGETLIDTAMTLNAMHPDVLCVRHPNSGAVQLLSEKVNCAVINGGDGTHEHPTQALLDAQTIRRRRGKIAGPDCGNLRRYPAQPGRAIQHPAADHDGRAGTAGGATDAAADRGRAVRRRRVLIT